MKTMTNIKQNLDNNQGLDQLAEFLNNKIINETQLIHKDQNSEIEEIQSININNKLCMTEFQKNNKKKQRVHKSPDPITINHLEARRGSKTPLASRDLKLKNGANLNEVYHFNNDGHFIGESKKSTFVGSELIKQNEFHGSNLKDGKSRNNQLKYSTYSKQANIAKCTRDASTKQTYDTKNCNINLRLANNYSNTDSIAEIKDTKIGSFVFNQIKPHQNGKVVHYPQNTRNELINRLGFTTYNRSNKGGILSSKTSPTRNSQINNINQIMQEK